MTSAFHFVCSGDDTDGGEGFPSPPPFGYAYAPSEENKKDVRKFSARFLAFSNKISTIKKLCCPRAEDKVVFEDLRFRGLGQGLDLRSQGQGLQNVSSRTPPLKKISSRAEELNFSLKLGGDQKRKKSALSEELNLSSKLGEDQRKKVFTVWSLFAIQPRSQNHHCWHCDWGGGLPGPPLTTPTL